MIGGLIALVVVAFIGWRVFGGSGSSTVCTGSNLELCLTASSTNVSLSEEIQLSAELMNNSDSTLEVPAAQICNEPAITTPTGAEFSLESPICTFGFEGTVPITPGSMLATRPMFIASEHLEAGMNEIIGSFDGSEVTLIIEAS